MKHHVQESGGEILPIKALDFRFWILHPRNHEKQNLKWQREDAFTTVLVRMSRFSPLPSFLQQHCNVQKWAEAKKCEYTDELAWMVQWVERRLESQVSHIWFGNHLWHSTISGAGTWGTRIRGCLSFHCIISCWVGIENYNLEGPNLK